MPQALVVQDPHQGRRVTGLDDAAPLEQRCEPIEHRQGMPGTSAEIPRLRSRCRRQPLRIEPDAGACEGLDVGEPGDPARPA
jgi:hypothetical protein